MSAPTPARRVAFEVVRRTFEHDAWTDRALRSAAARHELEGRELAFAQRLAYGAVQRRGTTDHLIKRLGRRRADQLDPPVVAALRLGLYELLFTGGSPDRAVVDQAVELAKRGMRAGGTGSRARANAASGMANAVLRRAARDREELLATLEDSTPAAAGLAHSYPRWIAELWWEELGPDVARALMAAMNEPAETALRVNALRADAQRLATELSEGGEHVEPPAATAPGDPLAPAEALLVRGALGSNLRARVASGELVPQSRASQAVVGALGAEPGERVLDLCAGPGIKTTALAARLGGGGEVIAIEHDPGRADEIRELCERMGAGNVRVEVADAAADDLGEGYDRVLVDPPCSDLGALASRPDARWRKSAAQVERLAGLQGEILARGAAALRPGGALVYSTCTISARENEGVVAAALERHPGLIADDLGAEHPRLASARDPRFWQIRPDRDRTTGFFIARLRREL